MDAFADLRWDPQEILDFGNRILVTAQQSGRGSGSGVAVRLSVFEVFTLRGGLVTGRKTSSSARRPSGPPGHRSSAWVSARALTESRASSSDTLAPGKRSEMRPLLSLSQRQRSGCGRT